MADAVTLAYLHTDEVTHSWHHSVTNLLLFDASQHQRIIRGGYIAFSSGYDVERSRNIVTKQFLDDKSAEWLLWIDSDMGFEPDALERMIATAESHDAKIVGGLCFGWKDVGGDGLSGMARRPFTTMFMWNRQPDGKEAFNPVWHYPVNTVVPVDATGAAFILVHRDVFEAIRAEHGDRWYSRLPNATGEPDSYFGEDISFCIRAKAAGFPILVHTGIRTNHHKNVHVNEAVFWAQFEAPPATEPITVLVPVVGRPGNAEPFMSSLSASTGLANVVAICEHDDIESIDAWFKAGADVLRVNVRSFADKVNAAFEANAYEGDPWVLLVGDDVRFHSGWWNSAHQTAVVSGKSVIGTNDMFNPRVLSGEHATHLVLSTKYVQEHGASWDGPGVVCHPGYRHWYVDDEIVTVAKQRGEFAVSLASIVEHLHPLAGKADDDETYRKGQRHSAKDRALFLNRLKEHTS